MTEDTKGLKFDNLKVRYELIPVLALNLLAQLYTIGAWKYEADNWRKGLDYSRCYGALQRHANAFFAGEWMDDKGPKPTGLPHLTCVMFCCCSLLEFHYTHPEMNDLPYVPESVKAMLKFEYTQEEYEKFKATFKDEEDDEAVQEI